MTDCASFLVRASKTLAGITAQQSIRSPVRVVLASGTAAASGTTIAGTSSSRSNVAFAEGVDNVPDALKDDNLNNNEVSEESARSVLMSVGEQLSFGGTLGFATGLTIRKIGRVALVLIGAEVVILQYMSYRKWVSVNWHKMSQELAPKFSRSTLNGLLDILVYRMPFSAAFTGGMVAGLRLSTSK